MRTFRSIRGSALGPAMQYRVLAMLAALGAVEAAAFALWPPDASIPVGIVEGVAMLLAFATLGIWLVLPHLSRWFLDVSVAAAALVIAVSAYYGSSASGQLACAMGLCLLAVYCAYFFPVARLVFQVIWMLALFVGVAILSPLLDSPLYPATVVVTIIALVWMVSHLAALLAAAAVRDPLTGVLNRRGLTEAAELVRAVLLRADRPITLVAIDLNSFKSYNDQHGHAAGDALLVGLTSSWHEVLRSADVLARTGGDEFVLVLPNTDVASAHGLLGRLHQANPARWSAGVVRWDRDEPFDEALRQADAALYLAKSRTRTEI